MDRDAQFNSLVSNGLDFLETAVAQIEQNPKYSIINFYAALEILLKSRLLLEHWTLVHDTPQAANPHSFLQGDFKSVSYHDLIKRLRSIVGVHIPAASERAFDRLRGHRNKLIHFFHPEYQPGATPDVIASIVADECTVWLHLHNLLTRAWGPSYEHFGDQLSALNFRMHKVRAFLAIKYDQLKGDLEKGRARGVVFLTCPSCGYEAASVSLAFGPITECKCLVCEDTARTLEVPCPKCHSAVYVQDLGQGTCAKCETAVDIALLVQHFGVRQTAFEAMEAPAHAYCPNCEWVQEAMVVPHLDQYFCLNCLAIYDRVGNCGWCGALNAGDTSDSFLYGCVMCEGRIAWGD